MPRLSRIQKEQLKNFYIEGKTITDICASLNISRDAFYYHKKKALEKGDDWEEKRLATLRSAQNLEKKETEFLNTLITAFDNALHEIEKIEDPQQKLDTLTKYVKAYYQLKAPKEQSSRQQILEAITQTIYEISQMALEHEAQEVVSFLHENAQSIMDRVLKK